MINSILSHYGIRDPTPALEPLELPQTRKLPEDHPCHGCSILEWSARVPYCFLPKCDPDIFKLDGGDEGT
jgi:hypothetical protein